jgi:hypothetical protein
VLAVFNGDLRFINATQGQYAYLAMSMSRWWQRPMTGPAAKPPLQSVRNKSGSLTGKKAR